MKGQLKISVGRTPPDKAFLAAWKAIEVDAPHDFFLSHIWIGAWLQAARPAAECLLATCGGKPVGAAIVSRPAKNWHSVFQPEYRMHETGVSQTDSLQVEYNGILSQPEFAQHCLVEFVDALRHGSTANPLSRIRPSYLVVGAASPSFTRLMQQTFPEVRIFRKEKCPFVSLARLRSEHKPYLSALSPNARGQLKQARRRLEEIGDLTLEHAASRQEAGAFLDALKPLHVRRWKELGKSSAFDNPVFEPFLKALIDTGFPSGAVDVVRASVGSRDLGYLVNFHHRGACLNYTSGFAYDEFAHLKPGIVTHLLAIEDADRNGRSSYNFLAGAARYKISLATDFDELSWLRLQL